MTPGLIWTRLRFGLPFLLAAAIFLFDVQTPPAYDVGILYVILVIASLWLPWNGAPFFAAGVGTALITLGYLLSPAAGGDGVAPQPEGASGPAAVSRLFSVVAIWAAAIASYWPRRLRAEGRRIEDLLRHLAQSTHIVPYTAPVDSMHMEYIDPRIEELLGYPVESWQRDGFWGAHLHPDDRDDVLRMDYLMRTHGGGTETEYRMIAADGRIVWIRDVARVVDGEGGRRQYYGFLMDVTETRLRDRQLAETQKMKAIGQLTGGLAHDFNNLLAVIIANLELLEDEIPVADQARYPLRNAMLAARAGTSVVQQLLAFAKREPTRPRPVALNLLIDEMIPLLARTLGEDIRISTALAGDLAPASLDAGQFEAALLNLAVNARDAMPGGGRLHIETANVVIGPEVGGEPVLRPGPYVLVSVSDTGVGMSGEVLARAVEPFFSTKGSGRGTGLGLSMVNTFAAAIGGQLRLESRVGEGTTARLYLPRAAAAAPAGDRAVAPDSPAGAGTDEANAGEASAGEEMVRLADKLGRR